MSQRCIEAGVCFEDNDVRLKSNLGDWSRVEIVYRISDKNRER